MKLLVLIAFNLTLANFAFVSDDVCFTLDVKDICEENDLKNKCTNLSAGEYFYYLYQIPESVQVNLTGCQSDEYAVIDSIRYSIPKSRSDYQSRTNYSNYCPDKTYKGQIGCIESTCKCCTQPSWHGHICNHTLRSDETETWRDYCRSTQSLGGCSVNLPRYDFYDLGNTTEVLCLDYLDECHIEEYNGTSWCYARWASVKYHCEKGMLIILSYIAMMYMCSLVGNKYKVLKYFDLVMLQLLKIVMKSNSDIF